MRLLCWNLLPAELNFKGGHECVRGIPVIARVLRPGNFRRKLEEKPGPVKIPSIERPHPIILNDPMRMIHSPGTGIVRNCALGCQLSEKADPGIPGYAGRTFEVGHVIAPADERKCGELSFKIELHGIRKMFKSLPHGDLGKSQETILGKGVHVLIAHPDMGIGMYADLDTAVKTDQRTEPGIQIRSQPNDGFSGSRLPIDCRLDRLTGLGSVFICSRSRLEILLRFFQHFFPLGQFPLEMKIADVIDSLRLGPPG